MDEDITNVIEQYETILKEMQLTLTTIKQSKQDSQHIAEIHQFMERFGSVKEFVCFINDVQGKMFYIKEALTSHEAAQYLGMKVSTLYKKTMNNEIPFYSPCSKRMYFKRLELEQWMLQNRNLTNEEMQANAALSDVTNLYAPKRIKRKTKKKSEEK